MYCRPLPVSLQLGWTPQLAFPDNPHTDSVGLEKKVATGVLQRKAIEDADGSTCCMHVAMCES